MTVDEIGLKYLPMTDFLEVYNTSQFRVGQNIIPKAFGTVFGSKAKMKQAKYPYVPIAIGMPRG